MEKLITTVFCDKCKQEITGQRFTGRIFSAIEGEDNAFTADLCEGCACETIRAMTWTDLTPGRHQKSMDDIIQVKEEPQQAEEGDKPGENEGSNPDVDKLPVDEKKAAEIAEKSPAQKTGDPAATTGNPAAMLEVKIDSERLREAARKNAEEAKAKKRPGRAEATKLAWFRQYGEVEIKKGEKPKLVISRDIARISGLRPGKDFVVPSTVLSNDGKVLQIELKACKTSITGAISVKKAEANDDKILIESAGIYNAAKRLGKEKLTAEWSELRKTIILR